MLDVHKVAKVVSNLKIIKRMLLKDYQRKMLKYSKYNQVSQVEAEKLALATNQ